MLLLEVQLPTGVYALMSSQHQTSYEEMLQAVIRKCEEYGYYPDPTTVLTDFEKASMGAVSTSIGDQVSIQGCFYHLMQSTLCKVPELLNLYKDSPEAHTFIGMVDALALLLMR